jgi:hypothetical protein
MAQYALLEEAVLQVNAALKASAIETLQRIGALPFSDALLSKKISALTKISSKRLAH